MAEGEGGTSGGPAVAPPDLSGEFPGVTTANFQSIKAAPYKPIKPMRFAKRWGAFNRAEILKNYQLANTIAQQELDTELAGMSKFAPAASALKRTETAADNLFNQQQRTQQVNSTMPLAQQQLSDQAARAKSYAEGRAPDSITDRALELNTRSASADRSAAGGFGQSSSVARKASDLMSAEQRIQLSQYGDQLTNSNIQTTAGLMLAPTAYSDAGQQIRTMPEVGGSRLAAGALSEANQLTMMQPGTVLSARLQQRQFMTGLEQQTRQFNAQGNFAESQFNAQAANQFALSKFGYQVGLAGVQAGVETANNNTAMGLQQQQQYGQIFQDQMAAAQSAGQVGAIASGGGAAGSLIPSVINAVGGMFSPNNTPNQSGYGYTTEQPGDPYAPANVFGANEGNIEFGTDGPSIDGHMVEAPAPQPGDPISMTPEYPDTYQPDFSNGTPDFDAHYGESESSGYNFMGGTGGGGATDGFNLKIGNPGYQFQQATGLPYHSSFQNSTNSIMQTAGMTTNQQAIPNSVEIGANYEGKKVYSNPVLSRGTDPEAGTRMVSTLGNVMAPFGAFNEADQAKLDAVGLAASDPELINSLSQSAGRGDVPSFVNATLKHFGKDASKIANPPDKNGLATAHASYEVMQNFNQASPEQKSLLVAGMGMKAADFQGKKSLGEVILPKTLKPATKPVTAAHALKWFSQGINAYPLTNKWDQFSVIAAVAAGSNDPDTVAQTAQRLGMLGAGVGGAEVPGITAESLARDGWGVSPHLGIGAIMGAKGSKLPNGFVEVHNDGKNIVAAPKGTAYTAKGAISKNGLQSVSYSGGPTNSRPLTEWERGETTAAAGGTMPDFNVGAAANAVAAANRFPQGGPDSYNDSGFDNNNINMTPEQWMAQQEAGTVAPGVPGNAQTAPGVPGNVQTAPGVPANGVQTAPGVPANGVQTAPGVPGNAQTAPGVPGNGVDPGRYPSLNEGTTSGIQPDTSNFVNYNQGGAATMAGYPSGKPVMAQGSTRQNANQLGGAAKAPSGWSNWSVGKDNNLMSIGDVPGLKGSQQTQKPQSTAQQALGWSQAAFNIYNMWSRKPGTQSAIQTAGIIGSQIDKYNQNQIAAGKLPKGEGTNYGQYAGAGLTAYNAYERYKQGDEAGAGLTGVSAAAQGYAAYTGNAADLQNAGYAGAALQAYNAYQAYKHGDKVGAGVGVAAGAADLYAPGAGSVIGGAYTTYQGWGSGDTKNGVMGGAMMMAGMAMMGMPLIGAALMATAVISNSIKTGKHKDQNARDAIREGWQEQGFLVDKEYNVTLADGSLANIGVDGGGGRHEATNKELLTDQENRDRPLNAYDVDYTNDLDYAASMGGMALTRLLFGAKAKNIDDIGGQLGNAALGNIGFNKEMTQENFNTMQANMRGFYAKAGIGSKEDLYQLTNAAFAEGRLSEADYMAAQQTAEMMFGDGDNGYNLAKQLLSGRHQGIDAAGKINTADKREPSEKEEPTAVDMGMAAGATAGKPTTGAMVSPGVTGSEMSMNPAADMSVWGGGAESPTALAGTDIEQYGTKPAGMDQAVNQPMYFKGPRGLSVKDIKPSRMTKAELQARNEARYAGGA